MNQLNVNQQYNMNQIEEKTKANVIQVKDLIEMYQTMYDELLSISPQSFRQYRTERPEEFALSIYSHIVEDKITEHFKTHRFRVFKHDPDFAAGEGITEQDLVNALNAVNIHKHKLN